MRVISKFHDYYDVMMKYDGERDFIYQRKEYTTQTPDELSDYYTSFIGFCGKIYPFAYMRRPTRYDYELILSYKHSHIKKEYKNYWGFDNKLQELITKDFTDVFIKYKTPIFVVRNKHTYINVCLKDYGFQKIIDPYTAWNSIETFMMTYLTERKEMNMDISDYDLAVKKGLQGRKYDFRREPTKKK